VNAFLLDSTEESIRRFLAEVREANRDAEAINVVLDNFASHSTVAVRQAAQALDIVLVYLGCSI